MLSASRRSVSQGAARGGAARDDVPRLAASRIVVDGDEPHPPSTRRSLRFEEQARRPKVRGPPPKRARVWIPPPTAPRPFRPSRLRCRAAKRETA